MLIDIANHFRLMTSWRLVAREIGNRCGEGVDFRHNDGLLPLNLRDLRLQYPCLFNDLLLRQLLQSSRLLGIFFSKGGGVRQPELKPVVSLSQASRLALVAVPCLVQALYSSWIRRLRLIVTLQAIVFVELWVLSDVLDVNRWLGSYRRAWSFSLQACGGMVGMPWMSGNGS
jgi:hypothetical protein